MKSSYNPITNEWYKKLPESLSRHDVVFQSPVSDPTFGLPIGDGDTGCLLWMDERGMVVNINKTNLWDDSPLDEFELWKQSEDESRTSLRHGAKLRIDFGAPVFDLLYQSEFEARLSIPDACAYIKSETPFSDIAVKAFASNDKKVTVMHCTSEAEDLPPIRISLERWGSRTFAGWFTQIKRNSSIGLGGTHSKATNNRICIIQELKTMSFCVMAQVVSNVPCQANKLHNRASELTLDKNIKTSFDIYLTVATGNDVDEAQVNAELNIQNALAGGEERIYQKHCKDWSDFWEKSFVSIENDYLENLWYLNLYYANSECRGAYPPHFCNGIWGFEHDFVPWNYYFHYNMQLHTLPLHAANHSELIKPYFEYRSNQLPKAKEYCEKMKGVKGAFYADVADRRGNNELTTKDNCTPGAQIALSMWQYYLYTGDIEFLKRKAIPVISAVCEFYLNNLKKDSNGIYHIYGTQAYEGSPLMDDSVTDLSMIRTIFKVMIDCTGEEVYNEVLEHLAQFKLLDMEDDEWDGICLTCGLGKGELAAGNKIFGVGRKSGTDEWLRKNYGNRERETYYGFPDAELSLVFPSGDVGLADKGSDLFNALQNQARLHPRTIPPDGLSFKGNIAGSKDLCMGWCLLPIVLARLGLSNELVRTLEETVSTWIVYPQGFGHYGPYEVITGDNNLRWKTNTVTDVDSGEKLQFPAWRFRHFDFETLPIIATAINEMLLQSYDDVIRLFPAITDSNNASFRLAATGGFIVNAERLDDNIEFCIESLLGNKCTVKNPWEGEQVYLYTIKNGQITEKSVICETILKTEAVLIFDTVKGTRYVLSNHEDVFEREYILYDLKPNREVKRSGNSKLGEGRMF